MASDSENHTVGELNPYKNFHAISSLFCSHFLKSRPASTIVVNVISEVFKNHALTKKCALVEDIGKTGDGYHSCLMFWHDQDEPLGTEKLNPNSIVRITNVRSKEETIEDQELFHPFQLKLTSRSYIDELPPKRLPFLPKSVLSVFDGHFHFLDVEAIYQERVRIIKEEGQDVWLLDFKDEKSKTTFILKSEVSKIMVNQVIELTNKVLKIRSAKVLERGSKENPVIVLYKNMDAILHFNQQNE